MALNYFTCTLGQAALPDVSNGGWENVNELVDQQAESCRNAPAVGFAYPALGKSVEQLTTLYSFENIRDGSIYAAEQLRERLSSKAPPPRSTIALLSSSTPDFLFTWLGLIRLGYAVLLIAPQNQLGAIVHLCKSCQASHLIHDTLYESLATGSVEEAKSNGGGILQALEVPFSVWDDRFAKALESPKEIVGFDNEGFSQTDIAYSFHTSGTSSGLPKPIPQTHRGAVEVLPSFADGHQKATYSTTPLYHGGISDLFRAWSSGAMIWLFPGREPSATKPIPITASNILSCFQAIDACRRETPSIKYFTSVPYILQLLASDSEGLRRLQSMDCVGVGGAALPEEVGNRLVEQDVNLVSRYGSAECGFLLSSHRDYKTDKAWQYLRSDNGVEHLAFAPADDNKFEVVVKSGWPHMAKTNREDGSYATADLMTRHPTIQNAWRYDSRADAQLTLITGKKFDPAPLEGSMSSSSLLDDALIFGNGQLFPGALLFRSREAKDHSDDDLVSALAPMIEDLNTKSQSHARIPRNMLVPIAYGENKLQKSSKGTIFRNKADETYGSIIASVYERLSSPVNDAVPDAAVLAAISDAVSNITGAQTIDNNDDLFAHGIDSLGSIQIRHAMRRLLSADHGDLPITVVEDCGTISKLANFVLRCRRGDVPPEDSDQDELKLMENMVAQYSEFPAKPTTGAASTQALSTDRKVVLLTGATGALGAHILSEYRSHPTTTKVFCLVRGADAHAARERVQRSLTSRKLPPLSSSDDKVTVLPCKLSEPSLGLSDDVFKKLSGEVTKIVHAAWSVNFRWRLYSFEKDHIAGTRNLLALCLNSTRPTPPSFVFCSSIASVSATSPPPNTSSHDPVTVSELPSTNPADASPLGYSRSKWVTEAILAAAARARPDVNIGILRIGQLSGDSVHGIWNNSEAWPVMLGSMSVTKCLPDLKAQPLDWLAVDTAATAVIQSGEAEKGEGVAVRHILNPDRSATWSGAMQWLRYFGEELEVVPPSEWVKRLGMLEEEGQEHPALRLLGMWRERYGGQKAEDEGEEQDIRFAVDKAKEAAPVLKSVQPVDEEYFRKLWEWVKTNATG